MAVGKNKLWAVRPCWDLSGYYEDKALTCAVCGSVYQSVCIFGCVCVCVMDSFQALGNQSWCWVMAAISLVISHVHTVTLIVQLFIRSYRSCISIFQNLKIYGQISATHFHMWPDARLYLIYGTFLLLFFVILSVIFFSFGCLTTLPHISRQYCYWPWSRLPPG